MSPRAVELPSLCSAGGPAGLLQLQSGSAGAFSLQPLAVLASINFSTGDTERALALLRFVQFMRDRKLTPQPLVAAEGAGPVYVVLQNEVESPGGLPHIAELPTAVTVKQVGAVARPGLSVRFIGLETNAPPL